MSNMPEISETQIRTWVGKTFAMRGKRYFKHDRVSDVEPLQNGSQLMGDVQGTAPKPYEVLIHFTSEQTGEIRGECTCQAGLNCKHVAAVLYAWIEKQDEVVKAPQFAAPGAMAFGQWLGALEQVSDGKVAHQEYPDSIKQRLLYILEPDGDLNVQLRFITARLLKSGAYGKAQDYNPSNILNYTPPQFILSSDESMLREVANDRSLSSLHGYRIKGPQGLKILKRALTSGRCHWMTKDSDALQRVDRRNGEWGWKLGERGDQHLTLHMAGAELVVPTSPPWFIDVEQHACGQIESGQIPDVAEILLNIPAVELDCSDEAIEDVKRQLPDDVPAPMHLLHVHREVKPQLVIQLKTMKLVQQWGYRTPEQCHVVELFFDYDGKKVPHSSQPRSVRSIRGDKVIDYARDVACETQAVEQLTHAGLYPARESTIAAHVEFPEHVFRLTHDDDWPEWMLYEVPDLKEAGFQVEISDGFSYKIEQASSWELNLEQSKSDNASSLMGQASFMVTLDSGDQIDLIDALARWVGNKPDLLKADSLARLKEKAQIPLPLPDGRLLPAPGEMVANILHFMMEVFAGGSDNQTVELSVPQMLALEESISTSAAPVQVSSSVWLKQMKQLADLDSLPVCDVPTGLNADLRDYQREGLSWMQFLRQMNLGGIMADDMGLGKTIQALAHILKEKEDGRLKHPALVIAPTSLMHNWRREAEKFTPGMSLLVVHGPDRAKYFDVLAEYDLVITTYPLLARDFDVIEAQNWHMLVLDEAQYIKNPRSKVARLVRQLNAQHKICMTGTPIENHLGELWAQFDFLMPGYLYDMKGFTKLFRKPIELQGDTARQDALNVRLRPFMLRRCKEDVALELPAKTEIIRSIEIEGAQRELYESVRLAMQKRVRDAVASMGVAQSQIVVLDALLKMRQVCCDPRLVNGLQGEPPVSAKLQMLMELLPEMIEEGRRILLFSQFTSMLSLIEEELKVQNIDYVKLTGKTQDRITPIESFQNEKVPLFLISLKAGGVGLNLTAADTVIHYDPWWNPAVERQATDRAHRIGQDKAVFVYKLITEGSVEEKILDLQERKRELADAIHQKDAVKKSLWSAEELDNLFAPLN
ncbi:MAG: DEAD/DEAH box helicase [Mariprofundus sp.]|nr:DEAD/DEAH box helicase [Mariprofundus sp.]